MPVCHQKGLNEGPKSPTRSMLRAVYFFFTPTSTQLNVFSHCFILPLHPLAARICIEFFCNQIPTHSIVWFLFIGEKKCFFDL